MSISRAPPVSKREREGGHGEGRGVGRSRPARLGWTPRPPGPSSRTARTLSSDARFSVSFAARARSRFLRHDCDPKHTLFVPKQVRTYGPPCQ